MRIPLLLTALVASSGCATEPTTDTFTSELSEYQWLDDRQIPSQSAERQPALANLGGTLHMLHSGNSSPNELWHSSFNGTSWSSNVKLPMAAANTVGLATFNGQLTLVYQPAGQNRLVMQTSTNGTSWTGAVTAGSTLGAHTLASGVSLALHGGYLFAGYCREDRIQIDRFDGTSWSSATYYGVPADTIFHTYACQHVALGHLPDTNRLDILYSILETGTFGNNTKIYESTATGTTTLSTTAPVYTNKNAQTPMSIVTCGGITHLVHGGDTYPDKIYWSYRDGGVWVDDLVVPSQTSDAGAALGCDGTAIMVHNGGTNQLWWTYFGP